MIELSNLTAQTLQPGQSLTFDRVVLRTKNGRECYNQQVPTSVKLCSNEIYDVSFSGNITGDATTPLQIALAVSGIPVIQSAMNAVVAAEGDLANVSTRNLINNCCCDLNRISVINSGTAPVTIAPNSSIVVIWKP